MLIHQSQAGCVIGKAGSKLKEFRQEHDIDIKVYPECCPRSTDRTVQVTGKAHNVQKCITSIMDMLKTVSDLLFSLMHCLNYDYKVIFKTAFDWHLMTKKH